MLRAPAVCIAIALTLPGHADAGDFGRPRPSLTLRALALPLRSTGEAPNLS